MGGMVVKVEGEIDLDLVAKLLVDGFLEWLERREQDEG